MSSIDPASTAHRLAAALHELSATRKAAPGGGAAPSAARAGFASALRGRLRKRLRDVQGTDEERARGRCRVLVETLLQAEFDRSVTASPRFSGVVDQVVDALLASATQRLEVLRVADELTR